MSVSDTVAVNWVKGDDIGLDQSISDDQYGDIPADDSNPFSYGDQKICSSERSAYKDSSGSYSGSSTNKATITWTDGTDNALATTTWTCKASLVSIHKTVNGLEADNAKDISFKLYSGETELETLSTLGNGANLAFQTALAIGETYTICENPVPAGYTFDISVDGGNILTYAGPPSEENPTGEIQCFDFIAPDPDTQLEITFNIDNSFPGGGARTPGYWKNWNTCSGGMQVETAAKLGGVQEGIFLLDDLLPQSLGDFLIIENCENGVLILDTRDLEETNKKDGPLKRGNDAAYTLARALLAARLNQDAGACVPSGFDFLGEYGLDGTFEELLTTADELLSAIEFTGTGSYLSPKELKGKNNPLADTAQYALFLYEIIDDYNNGEVCTGQPSH